MSYYIIVFKNTFDVMNGEKVLNENNYDFRMMPTPTSITQSCGLCVRFEKEEYTSEIIENKMFEFKNIYLKNNDGYSLVK